MCRQTTCRTCLKTTWAGCGQHVQQVMGPVPTGQRCSCTDADRAEQRPGSLLTRLFKR
jgi:hypothetical protein